ncbi:2-isopropylmalate synthase [Georhizobium profundi]|uniref:2-isopropylmalate synthase n=1 Tax=Georhizobium profundi TaxID=2341112 RepID=A0A3Q8XPZ1_9HYPH|nr:2-isopropylmalate synthase [Georhizobium profundi]
MTRERLYLFDTTLRDGQQTAARPQKRSARGRANAYRASARLLERRR